MLCNQQIKNHFLRAMLRQRRHSAAFLCYPPNPYYQTHPPPPLPPHPSDTPVCTLLDRSDVWCPWAPAKVGGGGAFNNWKRSESPAVKDWRPQRRLPPIGADISDRVERFHFFFLPRRRERSSHFRHPWRALFLPPSFAKMEKKGEKCPHLLYMCRIHNWIVSLFPLCGLRRGKLMSIRSEVGT